MATTLRTNKLDYAPSETVTLTLSEVDPGSSFVFAVRDSVSDPGDDGVANVYSPFWVTDGGLGDLDGLVNGQIVTQWVVPSDPDGSGPQVAPALNATLELTASTTSELGTVGVVVASTTFTDGPLPPAVQTYFVPLREGDLFNSFNAIDSGTPSTTINTVISIAVAAPGTVIYYDHWEDGYGNPLIWGDGDLTNGRAVSNGVLDADDILEGGQSLILENVVPTPRPFTVPTTTIRYDGSDKIEASLPIAVTRGAWPEPDPGSLLAGGVEVLNTDSWGNSFVVPFGNATLTDTTDAFEYTTLHVMAGQNNTQLTLKNQLGIVVPIAGGGNLNAGQTVVLSVDQGYVLTANNDVQVDLVYGDIGSDYEMRWSSLIARPDWSNDYYTPVGTVSKADGGSTFVWLHNPGPGSINVKYEVGGPGVDGTITLLAGETKKTPVNIPDGDGAHFFTDDPAHDFFALSVTDANSSGQIYDWDTVLVPSSQLTSAALVGWGWGNTSNSSAVAVRSVVWVTPVANAYINIDFDGNGTIDNSILVNQLKSLKVLDDNDASIFTGAEDDHDMSGAVIFATTAVNGGGAPVNMAIAWGQDPNRSQPNDGEGLDLGTLIPSLALLGIDKRVLSVTNPDGTPDIDGRIDQAGDKINYQVTVFNLGYATQTNVVVSDPLLGGILGNVASLPYGKSQSFTASYTVSQADMNSNGILEPGNVAPGQIDNTAQAVSTQTPIPVKDSEKVPLDQKPAIELLKTGTWNDDGDGLAEAGETITYAFSVENKGNVTLYDVDVADLVGGVTVVGGPTTLDVGETDTTTFTGSYVLTQADIDNGSFTNVARATGKDQQGDPAQDDDDDQQLLPQKPAIELIKRNTGVDDLDGNGQDEGDQIFYSYSVQNTGNVSLFNVSATDNQLGPITLSGLTDLDADGSADDLAVGATASGSLTATLTQAQINAGSVTNIASTVGTPPTGPDVTDSDTNTVTFDARGSIGDLVWEDMNFNGVQDAGEPGISGITVNLRNSGGAVLATDTTNASGGYLFNNLTAGAYQVEVLAPTGYFFTVRDAGSNDSVDSDIGATGGSGSGLSGPINLAAGQTNLTVDAGLYRKATLGDRVWLDKDNDGIQDANEKGVGNVGVKLLDTSGQQIATTTTDSLGNYKFVDLNPGTYTLEFDKSVALTGAVSVAKYPWSSKPNQGTDDTVDSDVTGSGFKATVSVALDSGENDLTQDAAITPIVIDLNGNGIQTIARGKSQGTFDLLGTGKGIDSGWLSGDDGFLVVDRNGNGSIDDISEMFGGSSKGAGFSKLSAFDSNGDGLVDANDTDFASLKIWRDLNGNHQTDDGELVSLENAGLLSLAVDYSELPFLDAQGNLHLERGSATLADGRSVDMTDVYFNIAASDAAAAGVDVLGLAELMGGGFDGRVAVAEAVAEAGTMAPTDVQLVGLAEPELLGVF